MLHAKVFNSRSRKTAGTAHLRWGFGESCEERNGVPVPVEFPLSPALAIQVEFRSTSGVPGVVGRYPERCQAGLAD